MPPQRRAAKKPSGMRMEIDFDGKTYVVRHAEMTGQDARALRQEVGLSFLGLTREIQADPDIDLIAAFIWLAGRQAGSDESYDDVLSRVNYDNASNIEFKQNSDKPKAEDDSPEA